MNSLPPELIQSLRNIESFNEETFKAVHQSGGQVTSVRINPAKKTQLLIPDSKIPWTSYGYYLESRPSFTLDPLFHAGAYYVQEASSMFLEEAIKQTVDLARPLKVLDLCAAPGGKSTLIQSIISKESLLVSNEVIKTRVNVLAENMTKWGGANVIVSNNDPSDFQRLENYFDLVVVDAPCSGSGLFRKDPAAIDEWSERHVLHCAQRQERILEHIMPALKGEGILIYSTCSYSQQEDEAIADWLAKTFKVESLKLKVDESWGIIETVSENEKAYGYRFYPDKVKGEGFFIAAFKKTISANEINNEFIPPHAGQRSKKKTAVFTAKEIEILRSYLINPEDFFFIKQNEEVIAMPLQLEKELGMIQAALYIKKAGVKMGTLIRDALIPDHELAVSNIINDSIPRLETEKETALQYLRRNEIKITSGKKGWILLTHLQLPIGWIKVITNRINNYYPASWRILNK